MSKTVVGLFDDASSKRVENELQSAGFSRTDVRRRTKLKGGSVGDLEDIGIPSGDARTFADAIDRGHTLVTVDARDEDAAKAAEIMRRYEVRSAASPDTTARPGSASGRAAERAKATREGQAKTIPVVEEELEVGKREIETGGVHLFSRLVERPAEADVTLREEHVHVERHAVDRPATDADFAAAQSAGDIELHEHAERAVVGKRAHVVEEVSVSKDVEEHTEHIRDTVRGTEVEVEQLGARGGEGWMRDYRTHFDRTYASEPGARWDEYEPAYRMGYDLAGDRRYGGRDWSAIERDARTRWETDRPGTWERMKGAMKHAFDRARGSTQARHP